MSIANPVPVSPPDAIAAIAPASLRPSSASADYQTPALKMVNFLFLDKEEIAILRRIQVLTNNGEHLCVLSNDTIENELKIPTSTSQRALQTLKDLGMIYTKIKDTEMGKNSRVIFFDRYRTAELSGSYDFMGLPQYVLANNPAFTAHAAAEAQALACAESSAVHNTAPVSAVRSGSSVDSSIASSSSAASAGRSSADSAADNGSVVSTADSSMGSFADNISMGSLEIATSDLVIGPAALNVSASLIITPAAEFMAQLDSSSSDADIGLSAPLDAAEQTTPSGSSSVLEPIAVAVSTAEQERSVSAAETEPLTASLALEVPAYLDAAQPEAVAEPVAEPIGATNTTTVADGAHKANDATATPQMSTAAPVAAPVPEDKVSLSAVGVPTAEQEKSVSAAETVPVAEPIAASAPPQIAASKAEENYRKALASMANSSDPVLAAYLKLRSSPNGANISFSEFANRRRRLQVNAQSVSDEELMLYGINRSDYVSTNVTFKSALVRPMQASAAAATVDAVQQVPPQVDDSDCNDVTVESDGTVVVNADAPYVEMPLQLLLALQQESGLAAGDESDLGVKSTVAPNESTLFSPSADTVESTESPALPLLPVLACLESEDNQGVTVESDGTVVANADAPYMEMPQQGALPPQDATPSPAVSAVATASTAKSTGLISRPVAAMLSEGLHQFLEHAQQQQAQEKANGDLPVRERDSYLSLRELYALPATDPRMVAYNRAALRTYTAPNSQQLPIHCDLYQFDFTEALKKLKLGPVMFCGESEPCHSFDFTSAAEYLSVANVSTQRYHYSESRLSKLFEQFFRFSVLSEICYYSEDMFALPDDKAPRLDEKQLKEFFATKQQGMLLQLLGVTHGFTSGPYMDAERCNVSWCSKSLWDSISRNMHLYRSKSPLPFLRACVRRQLLHGLKDEDSYKAMLQVFKCEFRHFIQEQLWVKHYSFPATTDANCMQHFYPSAFRRLMSVDGQNMVFRLTYPMLLWRKIGCVREASGLARCENFINNDNAAMLLIESAYNPQVQEQWANFVAAFGKHYPFLAKLGGCEHV